MTRSSLVRALGLALLLPSAALAQTPGTPKYDEWKLGLVAKPTSETTGTATWSPSPASTSSFDGSLVPFDRTDPTWIPFPANDDGSVGLRPLGFDFEFYGDVYSTGCVNNNGNITFVSCFGGFTSTGFPASGVRMVAAFWADVDTRGAGSGLTYYKQTTVNGANAFVAHYDSVGYYNSQVNLRNSFQIVISDTAVLPGGNNVCFSYGDMDWTTGSASGGVGGFGGTPATVGTNKGDNLSFFQYGRYDKPGTDYDGPTGASDGVDGLDGQSICINTGASATNIPPVVSAAPGNVLNVALGSPAAFTVQFIAPESAQTTALSTNALPPWLACALSNGVPGGTATASCSGTPPAAGTTSVEITATDNGTPVLATTYTVRIVVAGGPPPGDTTPPVCGPLSFDMTGPGVVFSTISDPQSGIASVTFTVLNNLTGSVSGVGPFGVGDTYVVPGTPPTIDLRGTRIDPTVTRAGLLAVVTNGAGLASTCDPVIAELDAASDVTALLAPSPNPMRAQARIPFALAESGPVRLRIFDTVGREVARLVDETMAAGSYAVTWDGADTVGRSLASGVYVVRFEAGGRTEARTLTVVR